MNRETRNFTAPISVKRLWNEFLRAVSLKEIILRKVHTLKTNFPSVFFLLEYISGGSRQKSVTLWGITPSKTVQM